MKERYVKAKVHSALDSYHMAGQRGRVLYTPASHSLAWPSPTTLGEEVDFEEQGLRQTPPKGPTLNRRDSVATSSS